MVVTLWKMTLQIEGRCQKWQLQHLQVLQVPPVKDLNDSSGDFDDLFEAFQCDDFGGYPYDFDDFCNFDDDHSDVFEALNLTWNLQSRSPRTTRNATPAREANKMNKVCSSMPGEEVWNMNRDN